MFDKIRRKSRQFSFSSSSSHKRRDSVIAQTYSNSTAITTTQSKKTSFLDLPPELRNEIYNLVASNATLYLAPGRPRKPPPLPVALLGACKQTRTEFLPVLFSTATIVVKINGYDFSNTIRVLERMGKKERRALARNRGGGDGEEGVVGGLWVDLLISRVPSREMKVGLRAWVEACASFKTGKWGGVSSGTGNCTGDEGEDGSINERIEDDVDDLRPQWNYDIKWRNPLRPPKPASRYVDGFEMKSDLLLAHLRMVGDLNKELSEGSVVKNTDELVFVEQGLKGYLMIIKGLGSRFP